MSVTHGELLPERLHLLLQDIQLPITLLESRQQPGRAALQSFYAYCTARRWFCCDCWRKCITMTDNLARAVELI